MSKFKGTKGPWHLNDGNMVYGDAGISIHHPLRPKVERDANAQLIAAAPELLKALEDLCNSIDFSACRSSKHTYSKVDQGRAAIAKALGKEATV